VLITKEFKNLTKTNFNRYFNYLASVCTGWTDFDVTTGRCKLKVISGEFIATQQTIVLHYNTVYHTDHCFSTICGVAMHAVISRKITLIFQPALTP